MSRVQFPDSAHFKRKNMLNDIIKSLNVLYEDNHVIVVVKQANMPSQDDDSGDLSMFSHVKDYIKIKYNKQGNVFLGLVHRLDRPVSGVMVFAKTSKAASRISESIRNGLFNKTYYAVVNGILNSKEDKLENYLIKKTNKEFNIAQVVLGNEKDAKLASLSYRVVEEDLNKNLSLLEVDLHTGRFHQIRVQLAYIGHAIYGDKKYGSYVEYDNNNLPLALFAKKIKFKHPTMDNIIEVEAKLPDIKPWNIFKNLE